MQPDEHCAASSAIQKATRQLACALCFLYVCLRASRSTIVALSDHTVRGSPRRTSHRHDRDALIQDMKKDRENAKGMTQKKRNMPALSSGMVTVPIE